jgi:hypothetical protein
MGSGVRTVCVALAVATTTATLGFAQQLVPTQGQDRPALRSAIPPEALDVFYRVFGPMAPPRTRPRTSTAIPLPRPAPAHIRVATIPVELHLASAEAIVTPQAGSPPPAEPATVAEEVASGRVETEVLEHFVEFRADHTSTSQALAALAASIKLTYKLPSDLDRDLNGRYSGRLHAVLARILDGTDYFVKNSGDGVEVIVLGVLGTSAASTMASSSAASTLAGPPNLTVSSPPPLASFLTDN